MPPKQNQKTSKTVAKRAPRAPSAPAPAPGRPQHDAFDEAIRLFHARKYKEAKTWFEKAKRGPIIEMAANAELHIRMCERRLQAALPPPKTSEESYTYGVALLNARELGAAREHLEAALRADGKADHVHYALAVCRGLSGDLAGAYDSLKRAIELQPRNRAAARQDPDLEEILRHPPIHELLHP